MSNQIYNDYNLGNYHVPSICNGGICVDIGGNVGMFSMKYKDFFSKIHIYEPQRECNKIIANKIANINNNNLTLYPEAVYNTSNEYVTLVSHSNLDSGSVAVKSDITKVQGWTDNIVDENCKTISLEDILERTGGSIDYMKIDCETSEYLLLMDKDLSKIKHLGIELHCQLGKEKFDNLINHILKYFNNTFNVNLEYKEDHIEAYFESKFI